MWRFLKTREFFITVLFIMPLLIGLSYYVFFNLFLPSYTHHGKSILVPDISQLSYNEAIAKLKDVGLNGQVKDSIYNPNLKPQMVVKQYPNPLSAVKPNRTILLTLNKVTPPMVKMPKIIDMPVYNAKSVLESRKLMVADIKKVPDIARNMVLRAQWKGKDIKEGAELPQGSGIVLVIGEGGAIKLSPSEGQLKTAKKDSVKKK